MGLTVDLEKGAFAAPRGDSMSPNGIQSRASFNGSNSLLPWSVSHRFAAWLAELIDAKFESGRAFIRAGEPGRNEDSGAAYLSKVLDEVKPAPLERVGGWADALGLEGEDRAFFLTLAALTHAPDVVESEYIRMRDEVRGLREARQPRQPTPRTPRQS